MFKFVVKKINVVLVLASVMGLAGVNLAQAGAGVSTATPAAVAAVSVAKKTTAVVNINKATAAELETLPHIGPKMAQRIVDYRQQHGAFKSADDLTQVKGITTKALAKFKNQVAV